MRFSGRILRQRKKGLFTFVTASRHLSGQIERAQQRNEGHEERHTGQKDPDGTVEPLDLALPDLPLDFPVM